jgi:hypothetical protein
MISSRKKIGSASQKKWIRKTIKGRAGVSELIYSGKGLLMLMMTAL